MNNQILQIIKNNCCLSRYGLVFLDYLEMPKNELGHYGSAVTILLTRYFNLNQLLNCHTLGLPHLGVTKLGGYHAWGLPYFGGYQAWRSSYLGLTILWGLPGLKVIILGELQAVQTLLKPPSLSHETRTEYVVPGSRLLITCSISQPLNISVNPERKKVTLSITMRRYAKQTDREMMQDKIHK